MYLDVIEFVGKRMIFSVQISLVIISKKKLSIEVNMKDYRIPAL